MDKSDLKKAAFDLALAEVYARVAYEKYQKKVRGYDSKEIPLSLIISQPGVLNVNKVYDIEKYKNLIEPVFNVAYTKFVEDRTREGENLKIDLLEKLSVLDECAAFFKNWQPKMETFFKETIVKKFNELLGENADENRIMTETAAMLVKYTINEEVVRLHSHLKAMRDEINSNPVPGKKLDFNWKQKPVQRSWRNGHKGKRFA